MKRWKFMAPSLAVVAGLVAVTAGSIALAQEPLKVGFGAHIEGIAQHHGKTE